jgi:hypothetical protein
MVEFLVVQVAFGPDIPAPGIDFSSGTMTVSVPGPNPGTIIAGTVESSLISESAIGRVVTLRLIPAWDEIRSLAQQLAR